MSTPLITRVFIPKQLSQDAGFVYTRVSRLDLLKLLEHAKPNTMIDIPRVVPMSWADGGILSVKASQISGIEEIDQREVR